MRGSHPPCPMIFFSTDNLSLTNSHNGVNFMCLAPGVCVWLAELKVLQLDLELAREKLADAAGIGKLGTKWVRVCACVTIQSKTLRGLEQ